MKHSHKWQRFGGCKENPGCFDRGNGNMIFVSRCDACGKVRVIGTNYAGRGPESKRIYDSSAEYTKAVWGEPR
jgi:hypothetical protein